MENFLKSTKGYLNSFRPTGDSKRSKHTQSNFSPTFVGDVYEQSVDEVDLEEGRIHTTDNIFSSPVYKFNPEEDTSEALEVTEEHVHALTTLSATTLPDKRFEKSISSLHSASSSVSSPSDEETNEAEREDDSSLANTELESHSSPNPTVASLEPTVQIKETVSPESGSDSEDRREDSQTQLNDSGSSFGSPSLQRDVIQPASADILAALSFLYSTEEKDPPEEPSPVEASENTDIVTNLSKSLQPQPLGPSDEAEEPNNTLEDKPDDEVSFPDLVALISEIETSFDEAEKDDDTSQDEESYNTAFNLPQSDTDSLRGEPTTQGLDSPLAQAKLPSEDIPDLLLNEEEPVSFEDQPTFCTSNLSKSPLRELESLARQVLKVSHESSSNLSVENPFEAVQPIEVETSEVKESTDLVEGSIGSEFDINGESKSITDVAASELDIKRQIDFEETFVPEEVAELDTIDRSQSRETVVVEEGNGSAGSDYSESARSEELASLAEELASSTVIDSFEDIKSEQTVSEQSEEVVTESQPHCQPEEAVEGQAAEREEAFDLNKEQEPVVAEARELEAAVTEDLGEGIAEVAEVDSAKQTQSEEPVIAQARAVEPAVTEGEEEFAEVASAKQTKLEEPAVTGVHGEEVTDVAVIDSIEQTKAEEPLVAQSEAVDPAVTEFQEEEVTDVAVIDTIKQIKSEEPAATEAQEEEEVTDVAVFDSIEQTKSEEPVVAHSHAVEPAVTDAQEEEEVTGVAAIDSIEETKSAEPVVAQSHAVESAVTEVQREEVAVIDFVEQSTFEEPVIEVAQVEERAQVQGEVQEVGAATPLDNKREKSEEPLLKATEEVATETPQEELVQEEEVTALVKSVAKEQSQLEEDPVLEDSKVHIAIPAISNSITVAKKLKEENMQVRDAGFAEEKKDEDDLTQVSMESLQTNQTESGKNSLQMSTPVTGPISPPKAEGRDDDRSESSDAAGLSLDKSDANASGPRPSSVDDAIDRRTAKSEAKSLTLQSDRSSQRPAEDHVVPNQSSPRTPKRTKSPPRERSRTPTQDRPLLDKKENTPKKKLTEYIRKDLWNRKKPELVLEAINAVAEAAIQPESRSAIARAGGLLALIRAMEDHVNDVAIQIASCSALERLALDPENEIAIAEIGGVDAVLGAMMCHFKNADLHEAAWSTLWNLTCVNSAEEMTIDTAGGMQAIVSCMKQHINNPMVQKNACGALTNLCLHSEARLQALSDAGGFVAISSALQKHFKNPEVRKQASFALTSLLESHAGQYEADHGM
jgi:hypothetical protein